LFKYIEACDNLEVLKDDSNIRVFLAGGITGCQDWQAIISNNLKVYDNVTVINPRRKTFDLSNKDMEDVKQISWEHQALLCSDIIPFWFCKETLCPITLFELGKMLGLNTSYGGDDRYKISIGIEEGYTRVNDVILQSNLMQHTRITKNFEDFEAVIHTDIKTFNLTKKKKRVQFEEMPMNTTNPYYSWGHTTGELFHFNFKENVTNYEYKSNYKED